MRIKELILLFTLLVSTTLFAQIPQSIKKSCDNLIEQLDKIDDQKKIKTDLEAFLEKAPGKQQQRMALAYFAKKAKSEKLQTVIQWLSEEIKEEKPYIVLQNAFVIDGINDQAKRANIFISGESIEEVDYTGKRQMPEGAVSYDLSGKYIIPGLIDGHVHITHGTEKEAKEHLNIALKAGITSVREMGGDGRMLASLKRNMQIAEDVGPDIYYSTIIAGPKFFENDPRPAQVAKGADAGKVSWQRAITKDTDFKQVVAEVKGMGATAIKCYANLEKEELAAISAEAKKQGLKVWMHASIAPVKPSEVIESGAEVVSHADMLKDEFVEELLSRYDFESREEAKAYYTKKKAVHIKDHPKELKKLLQLMAKEGVIFDPTLYVYAPNEMGRYDSTAFLEVKEIVRLANSHGVKILAGTDSMVSPEEVVNLPKEMNFLSEAGLSNMDIIKAATIINAEALGKQESIGSIENGKLANLVVLNENPLDDIQNVTNIKLVMKRGKVIN